MPDLDWTFRARVRFGAHPHTSAIVKGCPMPALGPQKRDETTAFAGRRRTTPNNSGNSSLQIRWQKAAIPARLGPREIVAQQSEISSSTKTCPFRTR
jgi:hypothetical protein